MLTSVRKSLIYELVVGRLSGTYIAVTQHINHIHEK